jgi:predicted ATP-dependent protease
MFKVRADFDYQMDNNMESVASYSSLICGLVNTQGIRHFDGQAVAAVIEHGARVVDDQKKLSTRFGQMRDLLVEADHWAAETEAILVGAEHVEKAIEQKVYRSSLMADRIREMLINGTLMVDLEGEEVGQVNGLSVYSLGDIAFGKPSRITASTYLGKPGVVNIEREVKLSGSTHDKGVLILSGYLGRTFAQEFPLSVAISIAFEQSYSGIDGDSASSTELYAILSSLSGVPIKQSIAVTGSVNQLGEVQPIGGANEKIEGFFDVCKVAGKLGPDVGVMIPAKNRDNLMLRPDIVKAAADGQFRVYSVSTIDEGISILTGVPAGEKRDDGSYLDGTVNALVTERLSDLAEKVKQFANHSSD